MKNLFFIFLFSFPAFAQLIPFPQDTIALNDRFNNRQFAAYDSQGKIHLTYSGQIGTNSATREIYYVKEESDGSFNTINVTTNLVDDNYPSLSIDQNDKVHIAFIGRDGGNLFQVQYSNNINGSFNTPIFITQGGLNKATPYSKIGPDSVVHFVYFTFTNDPDNIYYRSYDLKTSTLSQEYHLSSGETSGDLDAALDVDANGFVHIVLKSGSALGGPIRYYTNETGTMLEQQTGISGNISNPKIKVDRNNEVNILFRLESDTRLRTIKKVSGTFTSPIIISPAGQRPAFFNNFDFDNSNRMYVVYQSSVAASGRGFYLLIGENNIFSDTLLVYDLPTGYVTRNSSAVIAKGNGDIAVFYAPGLIRDGIAACDIFMKKGNIFEFVPVELVSFTANVSGNNIILNWSTASETNNLGFEIQKSEVGIQKSEWKVVGFVNGKGTSTEFNNYLFEDNNLSSGKYYYRLKQIDLDGSFEFSNIIEIEIGLPTEFSLSQNYPNPFNPSTEIRYQIADDRKVSLIVYDILGNEVAVLVNEYKPSGNYEVQWNASNHSSGIYYYKLFAESFGSAGNFVETKKMVLIK